MDIQNSHLRLMAMKTALEKILPKLEKNMNELKPDSRTELTISDLIRYGECAGELKMALKVLKLINITSEELDELNKKE